MRFFFTLFFISIFSTVTLTAQQKIWLDENGNLSNREKAVYYRISNDNKSKKQLIIDYYISGKKAKEFYFIKGKPDGKYSEFYDSGEVKITGKFEDGYKEGTWKTYYKNGKIKEKGRYNKGEKVGVWKIYYKND
ncbi:toxin-antitoxin system YwqK family antitoxin [Polaribacter aestuariivivens]|uniref:toxin-antitoxin system YwqK family antitoxin n=1 Tax=Polaribacter aestuariivivens TaxID=2304626 RepID=UPI003F498C28